MQSVGDIVAGLGFVPPTPEVLAVARARRLDDEAKAQHDARLRIDRAVLETVGKRHHKAVPEDLSAELRAWDFSKGVGPMIYGERGVGKTHAAAAMLKHHCPLNGWERIAWINTATLFQSKRDSFNDRMVEVLLPNIMRSDIVVLDDLGRERSSTWTIEQTYTIVNPIYEAMTPLIVTSNLSPGELEAHVGPYSFDRFREMLQSIEMRGKSWRASRTTSPS